MSCKSFGLKSGRDRHIQAVHDKDYPFKCSICKTFKSLYKSGVDNHVKWVHEGKKPFLCSECNAKFATRHVLNRHTLLLHKESNSTKNQCTVCGKNIKLKQNLKSHLITHEDKREFECNLCESRFNLKGGLKRHIKIVHDKVMRFSCSICDKNFALGLSLYNRGD